VRLVTPPNLGPWQRALRAAPAQAERQLQRGLLAEGQVLRAALAAATPKRTGQTAAAWVVKAAAEGVSVENPSPVAAMLDRGTRPHEIRARRARALRFRAGGRTVFARRVMHPGTRPLYFVERTLAATEGARRRSLAGYLGWAVRRLKV
jgi:hypothetical protein